MFVHLAYIDPGTGSIIWQTVAGTLIGSVYVSRKAIRHIVASGKARLVRPKSKSPASKPNNDIAS